MGHSPILGAVESFPGEQRVADVDGTGCEGNLAEVVEGVVGHRLTRQVDPEIAHLEDKTLSAARIGRDQRREVTVGQSHLVERSDTHRDDHTDRRDSPAVASAP